MTSERDAVLSQLRQERASLIEAKRLINKDIIEHEKQLRGIGVGLVANKARQEVRFSSTSFLQ